ncbi:aspartate aminotransferase [gamma proteobacterium IMCC1989]|nr:aspartate aminotransferase [gamma proteobacterium IMCC1989]
MSIAQRLKGGGMSVIVQMSEKAQALREQGRPIINLCIGEPDFNTPESVAVAAQEAITRHDTHYPPTAGTDTLRDAVCQKLLRDNDVLATSSEVLIANGAKQLLFNAFFATLNSDDEVIIPAPYWSSYLDIVRVCSGISRIVHCGSSAGFKLTPEQLQDAITPNTRWVLLNSPSNSTGAVYTEQQWQALAKVLSQHPNVWIMTDDIYEHLVYDQDYCSFLQAAPALASRTLMINGVSKAYAMTGWRVGYAYGPQTLIKAMTSVQNYSTSGVCTIAQAAAVAALHSGRTILHERRDILKQRRDRLVDRINTIDGLHCQTPDGAFYLWVHCGELFNTHTPDGSLIHNDVALCHYLLDCAAVAMVPGSAFGENQYIRISFACAWDELEKACYRIDQACQALHTDEAVTR